MYEFNTFLISVINQIYLIKATESKYIDPKLKNEMPEDSYYNGLSVMNNKGE